MVELGGVGIFLQEESDHEVEAIRNVHTLPHVL